MYNLKKTASNSEKNPKVIPIKDLLLYDYCPAYFVNRKTLKQDRIVTSAEKVIKSIIARYWLERSADAAPTIKTLEPLVDNLFIQGGGDASLAIKEYLQQVVSHSGRILFERVVMIEPIFTISTDSGVVVQVTPNVIIDAGNDHLKALLYPINPFSQNNKSPHNLLTNTSIVANSCFLLEELKIRTVLMVYPDMVVHVKPNWRQNKSTRARISHVADGIANERYYHRTGGWCTSCAMYSVPGMCQ